MAGSDDLLAILRFSTSLAVERGWLLNVLDGDELGVGQRCWCEARQLASHAAQVESRARYPALALN